MIPEGAATPFALLGFVRLAAYLAQPHVRARGLCMLQIADTYAWKCTLCVLQAALR